MDLTVCVNGGIRILAAYVILGIESEKEYKVFPVESGVFKIAILNSDGIADMYSAIVTFLYNRHPLS